VTGIIIGVKKKLQICNLQNKYFLIYATINLNIFSFLQLDSAGENGRTFEIGVEMVAVFDSADCFHPIRPSMKT